MHMNVSVVSLCLDLLHNLVVFITVLPPLAALFDFFILFIYPLIQSFLLPSQIKIFV